MNGSVPSPTASKEEKASKKYGLQYAMFIWIEYMKDINTYNSRRKQIITNRQYAEGLQSIEKYKNLLDLDGDTSFVNLDFTPISRIPTIVDNIEGKLMNQSFKIQCNPIDSESLTQYDEYRRKLYANMYLSKIAQPIEELTGIPVVPLGDKIMKSKDDVEMHLRLNYKMDAAMSMESAINWVNNNNFFEDTRRKIIRDLIVNKKAGIQRYYDSAKNIRHEYVDFADIITPYSKYDDFRNIPYVAVLKQYQLWEVAAQNPDFTEEQLFDIAQQYAGKNQNPSWNWGGTYEGYYRSDSGSQPYRNFNISVLEFYFICSNSEKRVKKKSNKGVSFFEEKPSSYSLDVKPSTIPVVDLGDSWGVKGEKLTVSKAEKKNVEDARVYFAEIKSNRRKENVEVVEKSAKYVYEGRWIPNSDYIYGYQMMNNIPRKRVNGSYSPEAELPISLIAPNIYDMQNKSLVERLIPLADQMVLAHLKFQQLLIKAVPPGVFIDTDALNGVILAAGEGAKPIDILKMYQQTGSVVGSSTREDGSVINGRFVENLPNGIGRDFQAYIATQQHYMQLMNDVIGFNSAVDASTPNNDSLVGVQKMAAQATQNALRPYYNAHLNLILRSTEQLSLMIQDSAEYNWEAFSMALGEQAADTLRYGRKIAFNQFAIEIEVSPDDEEKMQIDAMINLGLQTGTLFVSDAIRIRQELKGSAKLASQLLVVLENKNKEDKIKESMQLQEQNAQVQQQSAAATSQMKQQEMQLEMQLYAQKIEHEYAIKAQFEQSLLQGQMALQQLKNEGAYTVAEINSDGKVNVQDAANRGKVVSQQVASQSDIEKEKIKSQSQLMGKRMEQFTKLSEKEVEEDND